MLGTGEPGGKPEGPSLVPAHQGGERLVITGQGRFNQAFIVSFRHRSGVHYMGPLFRFDLFEAPVHEAVYPGIGLLEKFLCVLALFGGEDGADLLTDMGAIDGHICLK